MRPIYWLHLSDLHFGAEGRDVMLQAMAEFFEKLGELPKAFPAAPDLLLISGDVAFAGKPEEYKLADEFLGKLLGELRTHYPDCEPAVIPVPGNHDLVRPKPASKAFLGYDVFNRYAESTDDDPTVRSLNQLLWDKEPDAEIIEALFPGYLAWVKEKIVMLRSHAGVMAVHMSHIPGDLCVEIAVHDAIPLCVVGLNSAWLQYHDGEFEGRLCLPTRQFQAALPNAAMVDLQTFFSKQQRRAILMLHHPPSWLSARGRTMFLSEIYPPDRFDICLYGHMHACRARQEGFGGGLARYEFQSPSLCGLSHYGRKNEERSFGFTLGCLTSDGEIRIWPYIRRQLDAGHQSFLWDQTVGDGKEHPEGVVIRDSDREEIHGSSAPLTATEGVVLRISLVDFNPVRDPRRAVPIEFAETIGQVFMRVAENDMASRTAEVLDRRDGGVTILLARGRDQAWGDLLRRALRGVCHLPSILEQYSGRLGFDAAAPQAGVAIHVAHDLSCDRAGAAAEGAEIEYARSMLGRPARPNVLLSDEAYRYLSPLLLDYNALDEFLQKTPMSSAIGRWVRADIDIREVPLKDEQRSAGSLGQTGLMEAYSTYNLRFVSSTGKLLLGDARLPQNRVRIDRSGESDVETAVDRLVNSERVCVVGVTNENLPRLLSEALDQRKRQGRGFWSEIRIVFLASQLLDGVLDPRCLKFDLPKAEQERRQAWERGVHEVREFLLSCDPEAGANWECLQFNYMLPFEAQRFNDGEGDSSIRMAPILPTDPQGGHPYIESTPGSSLHGQLSATIDAIVRTATPIVEFNVYGHAESGLPPARAFHLDGVVSQRNWRSFIPSDGRTPCFPVSFVLLYTEKDGIRKVLLQDRTPFNTGGDFHRWSLISGKVNDEDFFSPAAPSREYQKLAYRLSSRADEDERQQLSQRFATENKLELGGTIPSSIMEEVWKRTALRELTAELGLRIDPDQQPLSLALGKAPGSFPYRLLMPYPDPFLLDREEGSGKNVKRRFQLYIKLYALRLHDDDVKRIRGVRPHANLKAFTLAEFVRRQEQRKVSVFLYTHFNEIILPLVRDVLQIN
jgi:hypothetical protein